MPVGIVKRKGGNAMPQRRVRAGAALLLLAVLLAGCAKPSAQKQEYLKNIRENPAEKLVLAWDYRPRGACEVPEGVNVMAPTWLYVEAGEDGRPELRDLKAMGLDADYAAYRRSAHRAGAAVGGTVVSFDDALSKLVVTEEAATFCEAVAWYARQLELDGVCLDFEYMDPGDAQAYTALVARLRETLPAGVPVAVAVTVQQAETGNFYQCYDHAGLGSAADYVLLMAYDQYNASSDMPGPVAGLDWTEEKLQRELADVPSDKLLLGIPFYYYGYPSSGETALWPQTPVAVMTWRVLEELRDTGGYTDRQGQRVEVREWVIDQFDPVTGMQELVFIDQTGITRSIFADTEASIRKRGGLTDTYHLKGACVWRLDMGAQRQWKALVEGMNG